MIAISKKTKKRNISISPSEETEVPSGEKSAKGGISQSVTGRGFRPGGASRSIGNEKTRAERRRESNRGKKPGKASRKGEGRYKGHLGQRPPTVRGREIGSGDQHHLLGKSRKGTVDTEDRSSGK